MVQVYSMSGIWCAAKHKTNAYSDCWSGGSHSFYDLLKFITSSPKKLPPAVIKAKPGFKYAIGFGVAHPRPNLVTGGKA